MMFRFRTVFVSLVIAAAWSQSASAHFLWLLTNPTGASGQVQVFFGEAAEPEDPALLDKVAKAEVWSVGGRGEPKQITLQKSNDALTGELAGSARQSAVILKHTYGVVAKGGDPFLLKYYAKTYPFALPGTWKAVSDSSRLPLEVVPSTDGSSTLLQVLWNGKALSGAAVAVVGPGIDSKLEGVTDEAGNFRCELTQAGVYSIRAKHVENESGSLDGKEYKSVRSYSTLTLHYTPSQMNPSAHNFPVLPRGVTSFGGAIAGDTLFVYGGNYGSAHDYKLEDQSGDLWKLNLKQPTKWEQVSGGPRRQGLAMVEHNGTVYRIGGFEATNKDGEKEELRSQADFARFDAAAGKWESLPNMPEPRSSHDAAVVGHTLYVVGGWNMQGGGQGAKWHDTALAMDLKASPLEWKTIASPSFKRRALSLAAWNGRLVCIGGMTEKGGPTTATAVFDPSANAWSEGPSLMGSGMDGFGTSSFAMQGHLYVTTISGSIQRLSDDGKQWDYLGQLAHPRFFHRVLPWGDSRLVVVGGASMEEGKALVLELLAAPQIKTAAK